MLLFVPAAGQTIAVNANWKHAEQEQTVLSVMNYVSRGQ